MHVYESRITNESRFLLMDLSVVLPTYNQADLLRECLRSLVDQTLPPGSYEIVVVNDGSTDHTAAVLSEYGPRVRAIRFPSNRGRSAARNAGIREAATDLVVLVDSDILVRRDFLQWHLHTLQNQGPSVLSRGPVVDVASVAMARNGQIPRLAASPAYLTTANAALERSALLRAGLFDEAFPGYGWEDFELGLRLKRLGIRRAFCQQAVAYHVDPQEDWDVARLIKKEEARATSAVYFYRKHPTLEVRLLIQATVVHRTIYWLQSAGGLLSAGNIDRIVQRLRQRGQMALARLALRGVLNRYYLHALERELRAHAVTI